MKKVLGIAVVWRADARASCEATRSSLWERLPFSSQMLLRGCYRSVVYASPATAAPVVTFRRGARQPNFRIPARACPTIVVMFVFALAVRVVAIAQR